MHWPYGFLARMAASVSRGSDSPSSFWALTRNWYLWPGSNPVISASVLLGSTKPAGTQRPVATSIFSTTYPLMGRPPSSLGFSHFNLQPSLCTSDTSRGPSGAAGLSRIFEMSIRIGNMYFSYTNLNFIWKTLGF